MKQTLNVSVSGVRFIVNNDAYEILRAYLDKIEATYAKEPSGAEIIADIEARVAELLLSKQNDSVKVIDKEAVEDIVNRLGEPEGEIDDKSEPTKLTEPTERFERRLYRNREGALLGGVLNGLSSYFNIDVTAFRILSVLLFVIGCWTGGTLVAVLFISYLVMWVIVPRAKTARQKMEMQGKPVTASSIENSIKEEINSVVTNPRNSKIASLFTSLLYVIGRIIKVFLIFIAAAIGVVVLFMLLVIIVSLFAVFAYIPSIELFVTANPFLVIPVVALSVIIPLLFVIYLIVRALFNVKWNRGFIITLFVFWLLSWSVLAVLAVKETSRFRDTYQDINTTELKSSSSVLYVNSAAEFTNSFTLGMGEIAENVQYEIEEDQTLPDSVYRISIERSAMGRDKRSAKQSVDKIEYPITIVSDSVVLLNPQIMINSEQDIFSRQKVHIRIYHPTNGNVVVSEDFLR